VGSVGGWSKFFIGEELGMGNNCLLCAGTSQGVGCGMRLGDGKVGGKLWVGRQRWLDQEEGY